MSRFLALFCCAAVLLGATECATLETALQDSLRRSLQPSNSAPRVYSTSSPSFHPGRISRVAILTVEESSYGWHRSNYNAMLEDQFLTALFQKGYRVADRSLVDRALHEIRFQQSGLTESDVAKLGGFFNVEAMLLVAVRNVESQRRQIKGYNGQWQTVNDIRATVSARLIGVESTEVLWTGSSTHTYSVQRAGESDVVIGIAQAVAQSIPAQSAPPVGAPRGRRGG